MKRYYYHTGLLLFVALTAFVHAGTISREYKKQIDFQSGGDISIENTNGNIIVDTWPRNNVQVIAEIKVRSNSKRKAREYLERTEIIIRKRGNRMEIRVDKPDFRSGNFFDWIFSGGQPNASIDFWIKIPERSNLQARSVNGSVETSGIKGRAELETTNGKILANNMHGAVDAETTNGSIYVDITSSILADEMRLHTVNGSVKLELPSDIDADLHISTVNGSINTDFPVSVRGKWGPKSVDGKLNRGGMPIDISTVNGSVNILEN